MLNAVTRTLKKSEIPNTHYNTKLLNMQIYFMVEKSKGFKDLIHSKD